MRLEYSDEYGRTFGNLTERQLRERIFPNDLLDDWSGLIETVEGGYPYSHVDLDYDLESIREPMDTFLVDDELNTFPEHQEFKRLVWQLDQQYMELTQEHPKWQREERKWWSNRILKYACREYVDFLNVEDLRTAGITIEVLE